MGKEQLKNVEDSDHQQSVESFYDDNRAQSSCGETGGMEEMNRLSSFNADLKANIKKEKEDMEANKENIPPLTWALAH